MRPPLAIRAVMLVCALLILAGCREVRVKSYAVGTTRDLGPDQVVIVRDPQGLEALGMHLPIRFNHEFGVVLLMGPHDATGWRQVIESIRASDERVRIVAFERGPLDGGAPTSPYRTYTLWIVPNAVYRAGSHVEVVTPSGEPVADTVLR